MTTAIPASVARSFPNVAPVSQPTAPSSQAPAAIILAAGKGTRMNSDLPKVAHKVGGRPMVCAVVDACRAVGCERIVVVVGYKQEIIRKALEGMNVEFAVQDEQLGTGHAVRSAKANFAADAAVPGRDVFVLCGDGPLIRAETLKKMLDCHRGQKAAMTLATAIIEDPKGYGRIVRDAGGRFQSIIEQKNATPEQLSIREVNPSYYCCDVHHLFTSLDKVQRNPISGEYYVTDVPEMLLKAGQRVEVLPAVPPEDVLSINTTQDLEMVDRLYRSRGGWSAEDIDTLKIFSGRSNLELANRICEHLLLPLGQSRAISFPDGEIIVKIEEDVRGRDCFVICSTCQPVNDNLMELLIYIDCLRRASADRITVVLPYFGYARQDRKDEGRVPITAKLVANMITAAGAHRVVAVDLHAAQIQGFFDLPVDHLAGSAVFVKYFQSIRKQLGDLCLVSPDVGNVKVAESIANLLGGDLAIINKRRLSGSKVETGNLIGNVEGKTVLMFDDMISTAGTVAEAARLVRSRGAKAVIAAATHPVLVGPALERLAGDDFDSVVVTNTIPLGDRVAPIRHKLVELCVGPLIGEAIHRIHHKKSVSALFKGNGGTKR
ncbi:MAG: ribose-phosphate diphosphokinase [Phycisphaerales bacterium]|nr:ribose-phosphate diphosphokinase [Phycisphaerales bacterium]